MTSDPQEAWEEGVAELKSEVLLRIARDQGAAMDRVHAKAQDGQSSLQLICDFVEGGKGSMVEVRNVMNELLDEGAIEFGVFEEGCERGDEWGTRVRLTSDGLMAARRIDWSVGRDLPRLQGLTLAFEEGQSNALNGKILDANGRPNEELATKGVLLSVIYLIYVVRPSSENPLHIEKHYDGLEALGAFGIGPSRGPGAGENRGSDRALRRELKNAEQMLPSLKSRTRPLPSAGREYYFDGDPPELRVEVKGAATIRNVDMLLGHLRAIIDGTPFPADESEPSDGALER